GRFPGPQSADSVAPKVNGASLVRARSIPRAAAPGVLSGVPRRPAGFVTRGELDDLRRLVLGSATGATGIAEERLGVYGAGGIGKTVLAAELARDPDVRAHFPDGVCWVTLGEHADVLAAQIGLLERLGAETGGLQTQTDAFESLTLVLADRRVLLV